MSAPSSEYPMLRLFRTLLPRLLFLAVPLALGCDGAGDPLAPATETLAAENEPAAPDHVVTAGTLQRIVFTSARKGGYHLFKMDPQGNNVVPLTSGGDWESEPAWSYDNKRIAMERSRLDASNTSHTDIYVTNADGTNGHWARSTPFPYDLRHPSWSPDGSRILLTIMQVGKPYLAWLTVATGQIKFVTRGGLGVQGDYPAFHPTGNKIIYVGPSGLTLEQISTDGSVHKVLVSSATLVSAPQLSPDGKKVAFQKMVGFNVDVYVKNLADGLTKRLTTHTATDQDPSWSPDGTKIAFMSDRSGKSQIWTIDATGGNLLRITHTATVEKDPAWSH